MVSFFSEVGQAETALAIDASARHLRSSDDSSPNIARTYACLVDLLRW